MNSDELYQEIIMDHAGRPRNYSVMPDPSFTVEAENPMCGDELTLCVKTSEDGLRIEKTQFTGQSCAICTASASLLTTKIRSLSMSDAEKFSRTFQEMLKRTPETSVEDCEPLGNLQVLEGVRKFPMRVKCATLAWHALDQAIAQSQQGIPSSKTAISED